MVRMDIDSKRGRTFYEDRDHVTAAQLWGETVWIGGLMVTAWYVPPHEEAAHEAARRMVALRTMAGAQARVLWLGDFDEVEEESVIVHTCDALGLDAVSTGAPTRWEGKTCIDWALTNVVARCEELPGVFSDHIGLIYITEEKAVRHETWGLKPKPSWKRPASIGVKHWREEVETAWTTLAGQHAAFMERAVGGHCTAKSFDAEWGIFQEILEETFRNAATSVRCKLAGEHPEAETDLTRMLAQVGHKGCNGGKHEDIIGKINMVGKWGKRAGDDMKSRQARNRLAKAYQLRNRGFKPGARDNLETLQLV